MDWVDYYFRGLVAAILAGFMFVAWYGGGWKAVGAVFLVMICCGIIGLPLIGRVLGWW